MPKSKEVERPQFDMRFKWDDRTYEISYESLDFGERAEIEEFMGQPWALIFVTGWASSYKLMGFLAYLAVRRVKAEVEMSEFSSLKNEDITTPDEAAGEDGDADPPTESGPEGNGDQDSPPASESSPGTSTADAKS